MALDRRNVLKLSTGAAVAAAAAPAWAAPLPAGAVGLDAAHFGVRPDSSDDQSLALQRALDAAAAIRTPLALAPGNYRAANLRLAAGTQLIGVRGATRLVLSDARALITAADADGLTLSGLVLDGGNKPLAEKIGLVYLQRTMGLRITDCEIVGAGGHGIVLELAAGEISGTTITGPASSGIISYNGRGLVVTRNVVRGAGNNGIQILRWDNGDDGSLVTDNRVEDVANRAGGSGQFGNGIVVHRAGNVIVRGNRIRNCAYSAVRGNAAANIQIAGNACSDLGEVALYSEFEFEGAVIANNTVDGAAFGVSVCNFNLGGRLAVVQGNIIRRIKPLRPPGTKPDDAGGVGIYVEADSTVSGNVIEDAPTAGIMLGWSHYLRDVAVTGNVVRKADMGIAVSVIPGSGTAVISDNVFSDTRRGAIVGVDKMTPITGDLSRDGAERYAHLAMSGNRSR